MWGLLISISVLPPFLCLRQRPCAAIDIIPCPRHWQENASRETCESTNRHFVRILSLSLSARRSHFGSSICLNICIYIHILVCPIYMHREGGSNCQVDAIVMLTWSKVWITKAITNSITISFRKLSSTSITLSCWQLAGNLHSLSYHFAGNLQICW